jgi:hypothetical protein
MEELQQINAVAIQGVADKTQDEVPLFDGCPGDLPSRVEAMTQHAERDEILRGIGAVVSHGFDVMKVEA